MNKLFIFIFSLFYYSFSYASNENMGDIAQGLSGQMPSIIELLKVLSYVGALVFGIKGALKLKEWSDSKGQQVTISQPITSFVICGLLAALPTTINVSRNTIFGGGEDVNDKYVFISHDYSFGSTSGNYVKVATHKIPSFNNIVVPFNKGNVFSVKYNINTQNAAIGGGMLYLNGLNNNEKISNKFDIVMSIANKPGNFKNKCMANSPQGGMACTYVLETTNLKSSLGKEWLEAPKFKLGDEIYLNFKIVKNEVVDDKEVLGFGIVHGYVRKIDLE